MCIQANTVSICVCKTWACACVRSRSNECSPYLGDRTEWPQAAAGEARARAVGLRRIAQSGEQIARTGSGD
eukprot:6178562-Pleurochrysis_carterae.AAC.1